MRYNWHANYRVVEQEKIEIYRTILLSTGPKVDGERYQCNCIFFSAGGKKNIVAHLRIYNKIKIGNK